MSSELWPSLDLWLHLKNNTLVHYFRRTPCQWLNTLAKVALYSTAVLICLDGETRTYLSDKKECQAKNNHMSAASWLEPWLEHSTALFLSSCPKRGIYSTSSWCVWDEVLNSSLSWACLVSAELTLIIYYSLYTVITLWLRLIPVSWPRLCCRVAVVSRYVKITSWIRVTLSSLRSCIERNIYTHHVSCMCSISMKKFTDSVLAWTVNLGQGFKVWQLYQKLTFFF